MFATFDNSDFPIVKVTLSETIVDRNDFENFLQEWLKLYDNKEYFTFVFDTQNVGFINPKYSVLMSLFIKELKKRDIQYLEKSEIYVYNKFTMYLLDLIFIILSVTTLFIFLMAKMNSLSSLLQQAYMLIMYLILMGDTALLPLRRWTIFLAIIRWE